MTEDKTCEQVLSTPARCDIFGEGDGVGPSNALPLHSCGGGELHRWFHSGQTVWIDGWHVIHVSRFNLEGRWGNRLAFSLI